MVDEIDRGIIYYLQYDGRTPYTKIAEELGITETTVRRRVKQLIDDGIMQIVGVVVEPQKLDWNELALINVQVQLDQIESVVAQIACFPEVTYLVQTAGEYDLFFEVFCKDREHFLEFFNERLVKIPGIVRIQSSLILKMHKLSYRFGETEALRIKHQIQNSE
jgi:Lrp/AsnC family transcriptional regulator for asnA, asnC and gidA